MNSSDREILVDQVNQLHFLIRNDIKKTEHLNMSIVNMTNYLVGAEIHTMDSYSISMYRNDIELIQHQICQLDHLNKKVSKNIPDLMTDRIEDETRQPSVTIAPPTVAQMLINTILIMRNILLNRIRRLETQPSEFVAPPSLVPRKKKPTGMKIKTKTITPTELETILEDDCGICIQPHKKKDTFTCSCNHIFGKVCFNAWMKICKTHNNIISCPLCRVEVIHTVTFHAKKDKAPKIAQSVVI